MRDQEPRGLVRPAALEALKLIPRFSLTELGLDPLALRARHRPFPASGLTDQQGYSAQPFVLSRRLSCAEVDAQRSELRGARCLRRTCEDVRAPRDLELDEPGSDDRRLELCFQQSAGDSALPQVDVALPAIADRLLHEDVADL
jgi:hypothetical protein